MLVSEHYACSSSSSEEEEEVKMAPHTVLARQVETAPMVLGISRREKAEDYSGHDGTSIMRRNLPAASVLAPRVGPENPYKRTDAKSSAVFIGGSVDRAVIEEWGFDEEYYSYQSRGMEAGGGEDIEKPLNKKRRSKRTREEEDLGNEDVDGIWAPEKNDEDLIVRKDAMQEHEQRKEIKINYNQYLDRRDERKISHLLPPRHDNATRAIEARTEFHAQRTVDYRGHSWFEPPSGLRRKIDDGHDCFLPKKKLHTFTGHKKGVQTIRLFPKTGHLLLSASLDGTCKIWDVYQNRIAMRTYIGHSEAARDVNFNHNGTKFGSSGFDRFIRIWDTESGSCLHTLTPNRKMCYCLVFYPRDDNILLAGASDNKIYQWDLRAPANQQSKTSEGDAQIIQEYNYHLKPVNSVTYIDDDARFVSTGDDKKVFVWEHNIPVPIKYISEPGMHAIPVVQLHPSTNFWCGQSLDNSIVTFQARDNVKQLHKRKFKGHLCSGYACGLTFSPNGRYLASGDAEGRLFIWDFKTTRVVRKTHCHDAGPCIATAWHPIEPSWIFTAGWDNLIKLWT